MSVDLAFTSTLNGTLSQSLAPQLLKLTSLQIEGNAQLPALAKPLPFNFEGSAQTHVQKQRANLAFNGLLGDSHVSLKTTIKSFTAFNIDSTVKVDQFDLDSWRPPTHPSTKPASQPTSDKNDNVPTKKQSKPPIDANTKNDIPIDFSALQALKGSVNLTVDELRARGTKLNDISLKLKSDGKTIRINPLKLKIAEGTLKGKLTLKPVEQQASMQAHINQVRFGLLLKELDITDWVRGRARINMNLKTEGQNLQAFKKNLNGTIDLLANDGGIKGFNLAQQVRLLQAKLAKIKMKNAQTKQEAEKEQYTDFAELSGLFQVKNGILHNNNLKLLSPYFRLKGSGKASIVDETLDFRMHVITTRSNQGQGAQNIKLTGGIPVRIYGTMQDPKLNIDTQALKQALITQEKAKIAQALKQKQAQARQALKQKQEKLKQALAQKAAEKKKQQRKQLEKKIEDAKDTLKDQLQNKLKGLFK